MDELLQSKVSVVIHTIAGIIVGLLSINFDVWLSFLIGIILLFGIGYMGEILFGKKGFKWWLSNGFIVYIFVWLVTWIYFFNIIA
jgi:hypothetical protein